MITEIGPAEGTYLLKPTNTMAKNHVVTSVGSSEDATAASVGPRGAVRWGAAALLILHGLIHALGAIEIWGWADIEQMTGTPSIDVGSTTAKILAAAWPISFGLFVVAGIGLLARKSWWRPIAIGALAVSQFAIVMWWGDAFAGTVANVLILAIVVLARRLDLRFDRPVVVR